MFDLHTHSSASDGVLSPSELVRFAVKSRVRYLGLTDHDTVGGIEEALEAASSYALELISGVEISVRGPLEEVHILGYYIDHKNSRLLSRLKHFQDERAARADRFFDRLDEAGIKLDRDKVKDRVKADSIGRPHIAQAILDAGYETDFQTAFTKYLIRGAPCYVPRAKMELKEGIEVIREAGGIPVLAHPALNLNLAERIGAMVEAGIMGIEAYYPLHTPAQTQFYVDLARQYGLTVTAGTDFHGIRGRKPEKPGCFDAPSSVIKDFLAFCRKKKEGGDASV